MIDLHSHILPQMDDGSKDAEMSHAMLRTSYAQGVRLMVATPHYYAQRETPETFLARRAKARQHLCLTERMPKLLLGAEVAYFSGISQCEMLEALCIEDSRLLLIELPFSDWTDAMLREITAIRTQRGLIPVLAHIERYRRLPNYRQMLEAMLQAGALAQCSAGAIVQPFLGRRLCAMVKDGSIRFLGTDCHNMTSRPPNMGKALERVERRLGRQCLQRLQESAARLLQIEENYDETK